MSARKTTSKAAVQKTAAVEPTPVKTEEPKTETVAVEKKAPARKAPVKRAAKKEAAVKAEVKETVTETVYVQFAGAEYSLDGIKENIKKAWTAETGKKESDIKDMQIYVKPEENAAYYVVNGEVVEGGRKVSL